MKRIIYILGGIIMLWSVSQLFIAIFTCYPVQKFWETDLAGNCLPNQPFWYINAAGNIATDITIFVLPLPVLHRLQLRKKQKYFLIGIFSLGFLYVKKNSDSLISRPGSFSSQPASFRGTCADLTRPIAPARSLLFVWHTSNKAQTSHSTTCLHLAGLLPNWSAVSPAHVYQHFDL